MSRKGKNHLKTGKDKEGKEGNSEYFLILMAVGGVAVVLLLYGGC